MASRDHVGAVGLIIRTLLMIFMCIGVSFSLFVIIARPFGYTSFVVFVALVIGTYLTARYVALWSPAPVPATSSL
jgi:hypothetical protein